MKVKKLVTLLAPLLLLVLASCGINRSNVDTTKPTNWSVNVISDGAGGVIATQSQSALLNLMQETIESQENYEIETTMNGNTMIVFSSNGQEKGRIERAWVEQDGDTYTLIAKGVSADGSCMTYGEELAPASQSKFLETLADDNGAELVSMGVTHSCTGKLGCSSCEFKRDRITRKITGCRCRAGPGVFRTCSHKITQN